MNGKIQSASTCFALVSDDIQNLAHIMEAHMIPGFKKYSKEFPNTTTIHFYMDSGLINTTTG